MADDEPVEILKQWWQKQGKSLVALLAIGLIGGLGWKFWQDHLETQADLASERYELLAKEAEEEQPDQVLPQATALIDEFPDSAYASLAALFAARAAVEKDDPDTAQQHLDWVITHTPFPEFAVIARLRLARLKFDAAEYDAALIELDKIDAAAFGPRVAEIRGDVQRARGDHPAARASYEAVLADTTLSSTTRNRVEMKRDDLGTVTSPASASPASSSVTPASPATSSE